MSVYEQLCFSCQGILKLSNSEKTESAAAETMLTNASLSGVSGG